MPGICATGRLGMDAWIRSADSTPPNLGMFVPEGEKPTAEIWMKESRRIGPRIGGIAV